ncbi:hypothetical protein PFISCL1PPCAC_4949 [Pristionchus fissidentatus]|uniref:Secreted protein n=1 Tax=Pristionchus fissidentatus TaxID=1538716 RepID=A0AAV5V4A7_9BILA|nr:hypothetical protein PFISCL1PPCAC_4949 [Pristionchus fissidentatus]
MGFVRMVLAVLATARCAIARRAARCALSLNKILLRRTKLGLLLLLRNLLLAGARTEKESEGERL